MLSSVKVCRIDWVNRHIDNVAIWSCHRDAIELHDVAPHIHPVFRVAAQQDDLMALGGVVEDALHLREALAVAVHERVVQDDERGVARGL